MATPFNQLEVMPYLPVPEVDNYDQVPFITKLFRNYSYLPEAVALTLDQGGIEPPTVLSVGASFGAEVDSVVGCLAVQAPNMSNARVIGVDSNPHVIRSAHTARYVTLPSRAPDLAKLQAQLPFFDVGMSHREYDGEQLIAIDAKAARARQKVEFLAGDVVEIRSHLPESDLILCNNVLYHLAAHRADAVVDTMADRLKPGGIMSFEASQGDAIMGLFDDPSDVQYDDWRLYTAERLRAQGIRAVEIGAATPMHPHVFQKMT